MPPVHTARAGNVEVRVVRNGKGFAVCWYPVVGGLRKRETFTKKARAIERSDEIARSIAQGLGDVLLLSNSDRDSYRNALQKLPPGVPLHSAVEEYGQISKLLAPLHIPTLAAVHEYTAARQNLPAGSTLSEAVAVFRSMRRSDARPLPPTIEVVAEIVGGMESNKMRPRSKQRLREVRAKGNQFAASFPDLLTATTPDIERYLLNLQTEKGEPVAPKTHDHHLAIVRQIYHHAVRQQIWPKEVDVPATNLPNYYEGGVPATVTPETMESILQLGREYESGFWMPFLVLGGFVGLRPSEVFRTQWEKFRWKEKILVVPQLVARKVRTPRLSPLAPHVLLWLEPYRQPAGPLYASAEGTLQNRQTEFILWLTEKIPGFHWVPDILRHSAASYRLAEVQSIPQVVLELGTSERMMKRFYNDPKTPAEARRWRAIRPPKRAKGEKIIPITRVA